MQPTWCRRVGTNLWLHPQARPESMPAAIRVFEHVEVKPSVKRGAREPSPTSGAHLGQDDTKGAGNADSDVYNME